MKALPLRTQLLLAVICIQLYSVGAGLSYWIQSEAHSRLEISFQQDLAALAQLPRLRDRLRQLDLLTDHYLLTGNTLWLERRRATLEQIRALLADLSLRLKGSLESETLARLDQRLTEYLAQQGQWITRKESGRLPPAEAGKLIRRQKIFDEIVDSASTLKDINVEDLERRQRAVRKASLATLALIVTTGLGVGIFLAVFLSRYLVGPVSALQRYASGWSLGREWAPKRAAASREISGLFDCMQDMARRLNAQYEKEQELGRLKTQMVSTVSHEFNNALSVINGISILLHETEAQPPKGKRGDYYEILGSNIRSLGATVTTLLDMGRLESGKFAVKPRRAEIRPILQAALQRLEPLYQRKSLELSLELPENPIPVLADPDALSLVATNLLGNAIKYTPERGSVVAGVRTGGDEPERVVVYVRDTGIGIPKEEQEKIFSGYYRTEAGKRAAKGFGVGLALASSIVEAHGGALRVESAPGKGSTFFFSLPVWKDAPEV